MDEKRLLREIEDDLRIARGAKLIYVEGTKDVTALFALLGLQAPRQSPGGGAPHGGGYVKAAGGRDRGGGKQYVRDLVDAARLRGYPDVFGILDGDGQPLAKLAETFDSPYAGPLFTWKAFCIENLLVQTGWPAAFAPQPAPDWTETLIRYAGYVALGELYREMRDLLQVLRIAGREHPFRDPFLSVDEIQRVLEQDAHRLEGFGVVQRFQQSVSAFSDTVRRSLEEGHTLLDGKWLVEHFAVQTTRRGKEECRRCWEVHAIGAGGHPQVLDLWARIVGTMP